MPLLPGARLGSLEIVSALGAGGMGEVYRARDTRLGREVALKILPDGLAHDPDRLTRFEREAKVLASLNHPHIAQIYGLEESGHTRALVMELIEGEDLADRMARGAIPVAEAIPIARQIADALDSAHERGIIHRDLKPANIKIRPDGTVKVLDFGLAKDRGLRHSAIGANQRTITGPVEVTEPGMVMGTAGYMSPEQASGLPVDARTDIWAFGCVLYEMLSGRHPFRGSTNIETLASVIKAEPDWTQLQSLAASLQTVVRRCLQKDLKQRFHHMADVRIAMEDALAAPAAGQSVMPARSPGRSWWPTVAAAMVAAALGVAATTVLRPLPSVPSSPVVRFQITPPADLPFDGRATGGNLAISPDGRTLIYHATVGDSVQLVRRNLDSLDATPIAGTDQSHNAAFSPDGQRLAFYAKGAIRTVPLSGGTPVLVCEWPGILPFVTWPEGGNIVLGSPDGLMTVPENGGTPTRLISTNPVTEGGVFGVAPLPGGGVIANLTASADKRTRPRVVALPPGTTAWKTLVEDAGAGVYAAGHLVFGRRGKPHAVRFDLDRLEVAGEPFELESNTQNQASVAQSGTYVALAATAANVNRQFGTRLGWLTREGQPNRLIAADTDIARHPRISPDGHRLALISGGLNFGQIWIYDLVRASQPIKITSRSGAYLPVWRPDGRALTVTMASPGASGIYTIATDGSEIEPKKLLDRYPAFPEDWRPDGSVLLFQAVNAQSGSDLMLLDGNGQTRPWLQTPLNESEARFSPDGRWVAYVSDQTGRAEVWIRPFESAAPLARVSADGGHEPRWSKDGRQVFYQSAAKLMVATIESLDPLHVGPPRVAIESGLIPFNYYYRRSFDVAPDGGVVAAVMTGKPPLGELVVVMNALTNTKGTKD